MTDKTFDEIMKEQQAMLRQEERDAEERLKEERESALQRSAALCYEALHQRFSAPDLTNESDFNTSNGLIVQATAVLNGETTTVGSPAPTQSSGALSFDFDALPAAAQRMILMIVHEPSRYREETIDESVFIKDTQLQPAIAAKRQKAAEERAQEQGSSGSSDAPAKKPAQTPPRSSANATATDAAEPPAPAPQSEAAPPADDETPESPSQPVAKARDTLKGLGRKLVERTPQ